MLGAMRHFSLIWSFLNIIFLLLILSCDKDEEFKYALIFTGGVTDIDATGATFHAKITDLSTESIIEYGFVWALYPDPALGNSEKFSMSEAPRVGAFSQRISSTLKSG